MCFVPFSKEVEPKLKYERIANDLTSILSKDAASCIAVHTKVTLTVMRHSSHLITFMTVVVLVVVYYNIKY